MSDQHEASQHAPLYQQIADALRARIKDGTYPVNAMLPSRRDLAQAHGAAQPTIDRAIAALVAEGMLRVDSRRGTFVAAARPAPASPTPARIAPQRPVRIGVITSMHAPDEGDTNQHLWSTTITSALERSLVDVHSTLDFVNRCRGTETLLPIDQAIGQARAMGAEAIALAADIGDPRESVIALHRTGLPFVVVCAVDICQPIPAVIFDNFGAGYLAAEHLLQSGHREVLFLAPFTDLWIEERLAGVRAAMRDAGLPDSAVRRCPAHPEAPSRIRQSTYHIYQEPACATARAAIAEGTLGRAIIAINDLTAFGVLKAADEAGLVAGRDFAIMGFDDHPDSRFHGLTTQRPPLEEMGREAGRLLTAALAGDTTRPQVRLRPYLVPRASTRVE